jgi:myo-inositol-1(or 4)-monophosphatase
MGASDLVAVALEAASAGARELVARFRSGSLAASEKERNDFVTEADLASERAILSVLGELVPEHRVLAEEGGAKGGADVRHVWLVDPLDGTSNFMQGLPVWSVSVACLRDGQAIAGVVLDPQGGNLFRAEGGRGAWWNDRPMRVGSRPGLEGGFVATGFPFKAKPALQAYLAAFHDVFQRVRSIRRCGSAALDLAYTAAGVYDGFFEFRLSPWDVAAGVLLIREAGGVVTDLDGGEGFLDSGNIVAGAPGVQPALRAAVARHADEAALADLTPAIEEPVGAG